MKLSAVMVVTTVPLDELPSMEREIVSRFLFGRMRGLNAEHQARWFQMWRRAARGEVMAFYPIAERDWGFHAMHMAMEGNLFENQDCFAPGESGKRAFRNWLKVGASLVRLELVGEVPNWLPGSLSYEDLSDDEMREFHRASVDFLRTPQALKKLWPAVKASQRLEMLETVLRAQKEQH